MPLQDIVNVFKILKHDYNDKKSSAVVSLLVKDTILAVKDNNNLAAIPNSSNGEVPLEVVEDTNHVLLDAYDKMTPDEKLSLLRSAILYQKNNIIHQESRIKFFKEIESFNLRTWIIKVIIGATLVTIAAFSGAFIYVLIKHGSVGDMSIIASLFKTLQEVLSIIFLTTST